MTQAIGPNQERWLRALESGEFKQGQRYLTQKCGDEMLHCCLGVGCQVFQFPSKDSHDDGIEILAYNNGEETSSLALKELLALLNTDGEVVKEFRSEFSGWDCLVEANDTGEATFAEIAAFCRAHPEAVFTDPR